ncbi:MAG TPA: CaiB/BaiF CoA-transferase family protein [Streptosporangiaceae bacterium]|nr:CaiB/BaiF CoA-transferase family protein [Streptosporangiaceae bacterium]
MRQALAGIRVLDLTRILSGPLTTMILADLGADVIKVEDTGTGDDTRRWGPPFQGDDAAYFMAANRNKRAISVDLKTDAGRKLALRLADRADVVVENFRPGTAARLGLSYTELASRNPRLVYASISGYGQTGPDTALPGYDAIAQARSGMMSITGEVDGPPMRPGVATADIGAGMWAAIGVFAALHARTVTGRGQYVDVALLDGQISWLTYVASGYFASGAVPARYGTAHPTIVPYQAFATRDGHIMIAVGNERLWQRFTTAIDRPDLGSDPRYATNPDRVRNRDRLIAELTATLRDRDSGEWSKRLADAGIPAAPIASAAEALADQQVLARDMIAEFDHPSGRVRTAGSPIKLSDTPVSYRLPPPTLGQHTDEVLAELGYQTADIDAMRAAGVIR